MGKKLSLKNLEEITTKEIINFLNINKDLVKINANNIRDSGYIESLRKDYENK